MVKRNFDRKERVADLIQKTLAPMLPQVIDSKQFNLVTIISVSLSRDLSYAKIFVSTLEEDPEKIKSTISALNGAAKHLRYELAHQVKLRIAPELKFYYDESAVRGFKISSLINSALSKTDDKDNEE